MPRQLCHYQIKRETNWLFRDAAQNFPDDIAHLPLHPNLMNYARLQAILAR